MMINPIQRWLKAPPVNFKSARGINLIPVAKKPQRTDKEINYIINKSAGVGPAGIVYK